MEQDYSPPRDLDQLANALQKLLGLQQQQQVLLICSPHLRRHLWGHLGLGILEVPRLVATAMDRFFWFCTTETQCSVFYRGYYGQPRSTGQQHLQAQVDRAGTSLGSS